MFWFWPNADFSMKSFKNLSVSWQQDISFSEFNNKSQLIVMILPLKHIFQLHSYHHAFMPIIIWVWWFCLYTDLQWFLIFSEYNNKSQLIVMILPKHKLFIYLSSCPLSSEFMTLHQINTDLQLFSIFSE